MESRTINSDFFGVGLPHLVVEVLIAMTNKVLMHYGCDTATGKYMQASYFLFFVELGISFQPLQESYGKYEFQLTHSWMKMLWEKTSMFSLEIIVEDFAMEYPREGDRFNFLRWAILRKCYRGLIRFLLSCRCSSCQMYSCLKDTSSILKFYPTVHWARRSIACNGQL